MNTRKPRTPSAQARAVLLCLTALLSALLSRAASPSALPETTPLDPRLVQLGQAGPLLYVTAHPDDESAAILTYLARGLGARVVLVSLTRGEGGQNLVGSELDEELGWLRTAELERAAAGYGVEVRFLGVPDFGYSKSVEETLRIWNQEKTVAALVRQIRELRPLAVISHWTGTPQDSGAHHQAAGLIARQAFALAGEEGAYPELLPQGLSPWQPRYFLVRRSAAEEGAVRVPADQPAAPGGPSYEELGWRAFQNHRSQGLHLIQWSEVGSARRTYLRVEATLRDGPPAPREVAELAPDLAALPDLFPSVAPLAERRESLAQVVERLGGARQKLRESDRPGAALLLVDAAAELANLARELSGVSVESESEAVHHWLEGRSQDFLAAAAAVAGVELDATADRATLPPGERLWIRLAVRVGHPDAFRAAGFEFGALRLEGPEWPAEPLLAETTATEKRVEFMQTIPERVDPDRLGRPLWNATAWLTAGPLSLRLTAPVRGPEFPGEENGSGPLGFLTRLAGRAEASQSEEAASEPGPRLAPVTLAPAVALTLEPRLRLLPASAGEMTRDWNLRLQAHRAGVSKISAWMEVPLGWYTPLPQEAILPQAGSRAQLRFPLTVPGKVASGSYQLGARAGRGAESFELSRNRHLDAEGQTLPTWAPARSRLLVLEVDVPQGLRVGYIGFSDDPVPALLAQLGIAVDLLDGPALAQAKLDPYDAVVVSNRMYDGRDDLAEQNPRLLAYVEAGGTLLVEHQGRRWDPEKYAPFPGSKSGTLRVSDETAAVRVLEPQHPVLNFPNRIGVEDWQGWVQERGLYFWDSWSEAYTPLLEMADPGEEPQRGALLTARFGRGLYLYCGLALFRQVRAGVPGGLRLYVNLLSQRRAEKVTVTPNNSVKEDQE